jgi:YYY domain-containing protein
MILFFESMTDLRALLQFLVTIEMLGLVAWPVTRMLLRRFPDQGWGLSKIVGIVLVGWWMWLLASLDVLKFNLENLLLITLIIGVVNWIFIFRLEKSYRSLRDIPLQRVKTLFGFILIEEVLFIGGLCFWTFLRGFSPDINGLEKFMDYGFMLSILRSNTFPPLDHYLAREAINYYYFGHYISAVITLLARIPASFGYNLQMSSLFALTLSQSFAVGAGIFYTSHRGNNRIKLAVIAGALATIFITLIGNLHSIIYLPIKTTTYWYPDATRFIANTIHEFPIYSFIVNDLHGHVSDIPIVLLIISMIFIFFLYRTENISPLPKLKLGINTLTQLINFPLIYLIPLSLLIGVAYATNAWDFAIYLILTGMVIWLTNTYRAKHENPENFLDLMFRLDNLIITAVESALILFLAIVFMLPFWLNLSPISKGIGIVPFGGHSPLWQIVILWGIQASLAIFFLFWIFRKNFTIISIKNHALLFVAKVLNSKIDIQNSPEHPSTEVQPNTLMLGKTHISHTSLYIILLIILSFLLIILPEIIFIRDIYPTHYRANTMFKFYYQAWIMLGLVGGYSVVSLWTYFNRVKNFYGQAYKMIVVMLIFSGLLYTNKAMEQGFNGYRDHRGSYSGTKYLTTRYPADYEAIEWLNGNITEGQPTVIEAVGDSYTDYARVSANTGLPSVLGWPVHEWLWRGSYDKPIIPTTQVQLQTGLPDTVAERTNDVKTFYETKDPEVAKKLVEKYQIKYIFVGSLEREKYPDINEEKFHQLDTETVYDKNNIRIYYIQ